MPAASDPPTEHFSLVVGGPFHRLLGRFGGIAADRLPRLEAAIVLAVLAWSLPALAILAESLVVDRPAAWSYFHDATVYSRYLIGVFTLIATERYADARIALLVDQFRAAGIVRPADEDRYRDALQRADRQSASPFAEAIMVILAVGFTSFATRVVAGTVPGAWEGSLAGDRVVLSWAGWVSSLVASPFSLFLVLRWCWRFVVWTRLLLGISRLRLALAPLHPDRCAGLGFLSIYPTIFTGFVFAMSCVVAATLVKELSGVDFTLDQIRMMLAGWIVFILLLFLGPLVVFVPTIRGARERALLDYGRLVHEHHQSFHRKWIEARPADEALMGSHDVSSLADIGASVAMVHDMRVFPIDRYAFMQLLGAVALPQLAVVLTQIPLTELARRLVVRLL